MCMKKRFVNSTASLGVKVAISRRVGKGYVTLILIIFSKMLKEACFLLKGQRGQGGGSRDKLLNSIKNTYRQTFGNKKCYAQIFEGLKLFK